MELSELVNSDTFKLTILPALLVFVVLFFWFRRSGPSNAALRKRKHGRAPNSRHDNLEYGVGTGGGEVYFGRRQELDDIGDEIYAKDQEALNTNSQDPYDEPYDDVVPINREEAYEVESVQLRNDVIEDEAEISFRREPEPAAPIPVAPTATPIATPTAAPIKEPASPGKQKMESQVEAPTTVSHYVDSSESIPVETAAAEAYSDEELEDELKDGLMLVLNVAGSGRNLRGSTILKAITATGFTYGPMGIFHYYSPNRAGKRPLFSLANMMEPGSFNLKAMEELSTPGLTLFANITHPEEGMETFSIMLETANRLADILDATVCDEQRGTLNKQCIDHIQGQILEHQRRSKVSSNPLL